MRFELTVLGICSPLHWASLPPVHMERVARIELANKPWQGFRLPLHHTRINLAPRQGIEPRSIVLETTVLPLHQRDIGTCCGA